MMLIPPNGPRKLGTIRRDLLQLMRDIEWWNRNRTDSAPMDFEPARLALALCDRGLAAAERNDGEEYSVVLDELVNVIRSWNHEVQEPAS